MQCARIGAPQPQHIVVLLWATIGLIHLSTFARCPLATGFRVVSQVESSVSCAWVPEPHSGASLRPVSGGTVRMNCTPEDNPVLYRMRLSRTFIHVGLGRSFYGSTQSQSRERDKLSEPRANGPELGATNSVCCHCLSFNSLDTSGRRWTGALSMHSFSWIHFRKQCGSARIFWAHHLPGPDMRRSRSYGLTLTAPGVLSAENSLLEATSSIKEARTDENPQLLSSLSELNPSKGAGR